jgi:hypothetical protein
MSHPWKRYIPQSDIAAKRDADARKREQVADRMARYAPTREPINRFSGRR